MTKDLTPEEWIAKLAPFDRFNERALMAIFAIWGIPKSMLDIGCGTGAMVNLARKVDVEAVGVDKIAREPDEEHDLRKPLNLGRTFVLITCLEVAEHIPKDDSGVFLNNVCSHMARGSRLVFSAAPPSQSGEGHVHLMPASYWRSQIDERGLTWSEDQTVKLRQAWQWIPMPMQWLVGNTQVFTRD